MYSCKDFVITIYVFFTFKLLNEEGIKKAYSELEWVVFISLAN